MPGPGKRRDSVPRQPIHLLDQVQGMTFDRVKADRLLAHATCAKMAQDFVVVQPRAWRKSHGVYGELMC